jgi:protein SCO1/2
VPELSQAAEGRSPLAGKLGARLRIFALATLIAAVAFAVFAVRRRSAASSDPLPYIGRIDAFSLVDQRGKPFGLADLGDDIWVADFIFTGCQAACPMLTSRMRALQKHVEEREQALGKRLPIRFVSFSVDPEVDTPEKLAAFATKWGADPARWSFLTGPLAEVNRAVVRGLKIHFEKGTETSAFDVMHGEHFVVVDGEHRIRGYFQTDPPGMAELKAALAALVAEKGSSS